jgi:hypothetical protein
MQAGTYVDPASHYEAAAEHCAKQGYSDPMLVRALLNLPEEVLESIDANPHEWTQRVSEYAMGWQCRMTDKLKAEIGRPPNQEFQRTKIRTVRLTDEDYKKLKELGTDRLRAWLRKAKV